MNLKQYLTLMVVGTALCWLMWILVIFNIEPMSGIFALFFFYASLFLSLLGTLSIIGLSTRVILLRKNVIFKQVRNSFRQALLLSTFFIISLILQSQRILFWWNAALIIIGFTVLEFFIVSYKHNNSYR